METRPPTITRILVAIGFALSCFALALFLWITFGGPLPLKPEGYRFTVPFDEATQLAVESDVRISGVPVGKVKAVELADSGLADATIELDSRYAPIPTDTRAMLRTKTLLGETFVELTPGDGQGPTLEEGGTLPEAQVADSVQLDEIWRTFDARTRDAFRVWMQGTAAVAARPRRRPLGRDRRAGPLRGGDEPPAPRAGQPGPRGPPAGPRWRHGLPGALGAPGPAPRPDPELRDGLLHHGAPQPGARRPVQDPAHLPARVARHPGAPRQLRRERPTRSSSSSGPRRAS